MRRRLFELSAPPGAGAPGPLWILLAPPATIVVATLSVSLIGDR
jgi:hypothetical protein